METVLLTGSSRGIGAAIRNALEKRGAKVIAQASMTGAVIDVNGASYVR